MSSARDVVEERGLLIEQALLATSLEGLGRKLLGQQRDPVMAMETALAALSTIRAWLREERVAAAIEAGAASQEQVDRWRDHLAADVAYLAKLGETVGATTSLRGARRTPPEG
ncbi:MAG: hypothetical protein JOZ41_21745 [Chloroflexi bacterium]|nr:hypothetical protein [Chloroflexota bacterium]